MARVDTKTWMDWVMMIIWSIDFAVALIAQNWLYALNALVVVATVGRCILYQWHIERLYNGEKPTE